MILFFVLVGFVAGTVSAGLALASGAGVLAALLSYSVFGALAVLIAAVIMAIGPTLLRPRPAGRLSLDAQVQRR